MTLKSKCHIHWSRIGITNPRSLRQHIEKVFARHTHQQAALVELYKLVLPDWERIRQVNGYPEAGEALWHFICSKFQDFDRRHHHRVMPGGAWLNLGFSSRKDLPEWEVSFENCSLTYHP